MTDDPNLTPGDDATRLDTEAPETPATTPDGEPNAEAKTIAKLRQENAAARVKAKRAEALQRELIRALAQIDGRLIDPSDLAFSDDLVNDSGEVEVAKITTAIDELIANKPHLAAQRPTRTIPQGAQPEPEQFSLADLLRSKA